MDPVLLGRTVRFHPCLFRGRHRGRYMSVPRSRYQCPQHCAALLASCPHLCLYQWGSQHSLRDLTLKMVQISPQESHSRGCWYLLFHNALLHGNLSVPLTANILAVVKENGDRFSVCRTRYLLLH